MHVLVNIMLMPEDEPLSMTPDEIAHAILQGLGGDENKDSVTSNIQVPPETGTAGSSMVTPASSS